MSVLLPQSGGSPAILRMLLRVPILTPLAIVAGVVGYFTQSWMIALLVMALGIIALVTAVALIQRRRRSRS